MRENWTLSRDAIVKQDIFKHPQILRGQMLFDRHNSGMHEYSISVCGQLNMLSSSLLDSAPLCEEAGAEGFRPPAQDES